MALAVYDYSDRSDNPTKFSRNWWLEKAGLVFSLCFIGECVLKIGAYGFVNHPNSYLRDGWNWIDFLVVIISLMELSLSGVVKLRSLRTFRVLRPLKSIKALPSMRKLLSALVSSLPNLSYAILFMIVIFLLFSLLGLHQFKGIFYQRCRIGEPKLHPLYNHQYWEFDKSVDRLCSMPGGGGLYFCPEPLICGTPLDKGLPLESDHQENQVLINYGITNFDNILTSFLTIFQMVTLEGWTALMYNMMDSNVTAMAVIVCCSFVFIGAFFLLNIILAVLAEQITDDDLEDQDEIKKKNQIAQSIIRAFNQPEKHKDRWNQSETLRAKKAEIDCPSPKVHTCDDHEVSSSCSSMSMTPDQKSIFFSESLSESSFEIELRPFRAGEPCSIYRVVAHPLFNFTIVVLILANIVVLACDRVGLTDEQIQTFEYINNLFTVLFFCEMLLKLAGLGVKHYFTDNYNQFDALLVIFSIADLCIELVGGQHVGSAGVFTCLRGIRIMRVLKLARNWPALRELMRFFAGTLATSTMFLVLFSLFIFIFMLIGMELYAYKIGFSGDQPASETAILAQPGLSPRTNFNNAFNSLVTIFIVAVGEDWNFVMYDYYRALKSTNPNFAIFSIVFFVLMYIMMNLLLLNLFLAILLASYSSKPKEKDEEDWNAGEEIGPLSIFLSMMKFRLKSRCARYCPRFFSPPEIETSFAIVSNLVQTSSEEKEILCEQTSEQLIITQEEPRKVQTRKSILGGTSTFKLMTASTQWNSTLKNKKITRQMMTTLPKPLQAIRLQRLNEKRKKQQDQDDALTMLRNAKLQSLADIKLLDFFQPSKISARFITLEGNSLFLFGVDNCFRKFLRNIVSTDAFDYCVLLVILLSTLILIDANPLSDPETSWSKTKEILDTVMTVFFLVECVLKVIVEGFACNGPESYLRSGWNLIDFFIVLVACIGQLPSQQNSNIVKILRMFRVIRPLRLIRRFQMLRIAIESVIKSIPQYANLMSIYFLVMLVFGILGTSFFKGRFSECHTENIPGNSVATSWECYDFGGEWIISPANFDNTIYSMVTLFTVVTTEGWVDLMWRGVDANKENLSAETNQNMIYIGFFTVFLTFSSIILMNLFVGVIIDTNDKEKEKLLNTHQLTPLQLEYSDTLTKCYQAQPQAEHVKFKSRYKEMLHSIATSNWFANSITICILLNAVSMALTYYGQSKFYSDVTEILNYSFTVIYIIEAYILISVWGKHYFDDGWRLFDFLIVLSAVIGFILTYFDIHLGPWATILRAIRILRVFKMVKRFKQLGKILNTFEVALLPLIQVGTLLFLVMIIFSVLGVFLFAKIKFSHDGLDIIHKGLTIHSNFRTFGYALLTVMRMSTGEAWNEIMWDCSKGPSITYQCKYDQDYASLQADGIQGCGNRHLASAYFISFNLICVLIMINMFISIILDGYATSQQQENMRINDDTIQKFKDIWMQYDPLATGLISAKDLKEFVFDLIVAELQILKEKPSSVNILFNLRHFYNLSYYAKYMRDLLENLEAVSQIDNSIQLQKQIEVGWNVFYSQLELPTYHKLQYFSFHDTLASLVNQCFKVQHKLDYQRRLKMIQESKMAGIPLTKWQRMREDEPEFNSLELIDQERFLEISSVDFSSVVNRIDQKALRTGKEEIYMLKLMRYYRKKAGTRFKSAIDFVTVHKKILITDSSKIAATRLLIQFIRRWKEEKSRKLSKKIKLPQEKDFLLLAEKESEIIEETLIFNPQEEYDDSDLATNKGKETMFGVARTDEQILQICLKLECDQSSLEFLSEGKIETISLEKEEMSFLQCEQPAQFQTIVSNEDANGGSPKALQLPQKLKLHQYDLQRKKSLPILKMKKNSIQMSSKVDLHKDNDVKGYYTIPYKPQRQQLKSANPVRPKVKLLDMYNPMASEPIWLSPRKSNNFMQTEASQEQIQDKVIKFSNEQRYKDLMAERKAFRVRKKSHPRIKKIIRSQSPKKNKLKTIQQLYGEKRSNSLVSLRQVSLWHKSPFPSI